jgi:hypothetical protein
MFRKIIFGLVVVLGLSVQAQSKKTLSSFETKVKNYVRWYESLPNHNKKREAANALVMRLNMMSAYDRGMWLATAAKYDKRKETPEVPEVLIDSLSNESVKKKLFVEVANYVGEKIDTIIILSSSIAKERTVAKNADIRKKIADWKPIIAEADRKLDSIREIPKDLNDYVAYKARERFTDSLADIVEEGEREIVSLRKDLINYNDTVVDEKAKWNSYLIDEYEIEVRTLIPHQLTNEELDSGISSGIKFDTKKTRCLAKFDIGHKKGYRWDEYSSFEFEIVDGDD